MVHLSSPGPQRFCFSLSPDLVVLLSVYGHSPSRDVARRVASLARSARQHLALDLVIMSVTKNSRLWQACLFGLNIDAQSHCNAVFHLAVVDGLDFLFVKYSPFHKVAEDHVLTFGYLPFYEYAVISRSYALGCCWSSLLACC